MNFKEVAEAVELTIAHTSKWSANYPMLRSYVSRLLKILKENNMDHLYKTAMEDGEEFVGLGYTEDEALEEIWQEKEGYVQKVIEENIELKAKIAQMEELICQMQKKDK